jgi:hypothetical protein
MSKLEQALILMSCFAGLVGFAYAWFSLLKRSTDKSFGWRDWISVGAISLASLAVVLRFVMPAFWGTDFGARVQAAQAWTKVSVRICAIALVLGLAGRPRLIVPIAFASFGTMLFWVMSTIP